MKFPKVAFAFVLMVAALITLAWQAAAMAAEAPPRTMTLTGTGSVYAVPDKAVITIGVQSEARTAGDALAQNTRAMQLVMQVFSGQGIEEKDLQTANFSVTPQIIHTNTSGRQEPPRIVGYTVSNEVRATIRDLDKIGTILDKAVSAGSNRINGIQFVVSNPEPLLDEARRLATRDALRKAKLYAEEAGVTLGPIQSFTEAGNGYNPQVQRAVFARAEAAVPVSAGQQELEMQVTITWALQH